MHRSDVFEVTLTQEDESVRVLAVWQGRRARGVLGPEFERLRRRLSAGSSRPLGRRTVRETGESLFEALPDAVRRLWEVARQTTATAGERLHLQLWADKDLAGLPWELLCEPGGGAFIAADTETSLARCVEPTRPEPSARPGSSPLRILIFAAAPDDQGALDVYGEVERIRQALADRHVRIERVPGGDRESLIRCIETTDPDVVHWIGHGVLDVAHGGRLLVESRDGGSESVRPEQLAAMLRGPSLVVLATCNSANSGNGDAMTALAPMLARVGVPSVVAMGDEVRDADAVRFTQMLYSSLAGGADVAGAVAMARRHLLMHETGDSGSWAAPVLYQRDADVDLSSWQVPAPDLDRRRRRALAVAGSIAVALAGWLWISGTEPKSEREGPAVGPPASIPEETPEETLTEETLTEETAPATATVEHDPRCPEAPGLDAPMAHVEAGSFDMGSTTGRADERPVHRVTLREPFCLGRFEITVAQWNAVMPDDTRDADDDLPVTHVSWNDAKRFVAELNRRAPGRPFRLPTEAEWEYAARAGTDTAWSFGDRAEDLLVHGNCSPRDGTDGFEGTAPVGSLRPNPWGLYDMHGNVTEWTADGYGPYPEGPATDPRGAAESDRKVRRGGNYMTREENCSSSRRFDSEPDSRIYTTGFRLAAEAGPATGSSG